MDAKRSSITQDFRDATTSQAAGMTLDVQQFKKGVLGLELNWSSVELDRVFRYLSKGQHHMEMKALQDGLTQAAAAKNREEDNRIFEAVQHHIAASRQALRDLFLRHDTNQDGKLSEQEFFQLLNTIPGLKLTKSRFRRLWNIAAKSDDNEIMYDRFLELFAQKVAALPKKAPTAVPAGVGAGVGVAPKPAVPGLGSSFTTPGVASVAARPAGPGASADAVGASGIAAKPAAPLIGGIAPKVGAPAAGAVGVAGLPKPGAPVAGVASSIAPKIGASAPVAGGVGIGAGVPKAPLAGGVAVGIPKPGAPAVSAVVPKPGGLGVSAKPAGFAGPGIGTSVIARPPGGPASPPG
jgi:Ca2+-binding EF-hand superfamily protein